MDSPKRSEIPRASAVPSVRDVLTPTRTSVAALVVSHDIRLGAEAAYEIWLHLVREQCQRFAGNLGADMIRPTAGGKTYTIVVRFDSIDHLNAWLKSNERKTAISTIQPLLEKPEDVSVQAGFDVWFTPISVSQRMPKRHKQWALTVSVVYPLTLIISWLLQFLWNATGVQPPMLVVRLITVMLVVGLMAWFIIPFLMRRLFGWLTR